MRAAGTFIVSLFFVFSVVATARAQEVWEIWHDIIEETSPSVFESFIQRYPDSGYASLARRRLRMLVQQAEDAGLASPAQDATVHWNRIKDIQIAYRCSATYSRAFEEFLELYPSSSFASLAHERLAAVGRVCGAPSTEGEDAHWNRIKDYDHPAYTQTFEKFLELYPNGRFADIARQRLANLQSEQVAETGTDTTAPLIDVPAQWDTDQAVIEIAGRVVDDSAVVELTLNDKPISVRLDDTFRVRLAVPAGTSELHIAALDEWGNRAEKSIAINRTAAETQPEEAPTLAIEVDPMDEQYVAVKNANVRAAPTTGSERVTTLDAGTTVTVTGKVKGADWYRIQRPDGSEGYVFASLVAEKTSATVEAAPEPESAPTQLVQAVSPTPDIDFGRYHALVIGINDYKNLPRLETAVNDATAVADVLRQKYGFKVTLLLNPGRSEVIRAMDKLRGELTERDNLMIYYAGHGVLDVEADIGFWMSVDAEERTQADWISIGTITGTVKAMSAKHVMIVSDSCYSGRLTRGLSVSVKTGAEREAELRRLAAKRSRTALVSGGLEPVNDGGGEGHSVFTRAFLTALRESTEVLDGQQLFTAVRRPVIVNADQTPEYSDIRLAGHDGGDFLFVPVSLGATVTTADAPDVQEPGGAAVDIQVWREIKDSADAADFETFIESFPSSPMVPFARNKLKALNEAETALVVPPEPEPSAPAAPRYKPGAVFQDCPECPEMVVIPPGEFVMGSPESEEGRDDDEGPQHTVRIEHGFALGKYEVTFAEWDACVADRGCNGYRPYDEGWGRGKRPAINVSWDDAKVYLGWLSRKSRKTYRLASESEWEYAARAGTTTRYHWGDEIGRGNANCGRGCGDHFSETAPVGSFAANAFGLHDMLGNVWEWAEDCSSGSYIGAPDDSYIGAPDDGSAWRSGSGNCQERFLRGGSWLYSPENVRAADRVRFGTPVRTSGFGFRVAMTLD